MYDRPSSLVCLDVCLVITAIIPIARGAAEDATVAWGIIIARGAAEDTTVAWGISIVRMATTTVVGMTASIITSRKYNP